MTEQTRLSVSNWNPGPQRGKEGATGRHIAGKLHTITLQEAIEYLEHDFLTNRFHVTHYGGCAVLFNKDTFFSDIKVSSFYLHDTRACEQEKENLGLCYQVSFQEQSFVSKRAVANIFSRSCLCTSTTTTPKKRGIGKKLLLTIRATVQEEHMDLVAGDFNGAAWRQSNGNNSQPTSISEEAFADTDFPMPPGPPPLWGPGAVPGELTDVCGFVRFPNSYDTWKVRPHGAFTIPLELPEPSSKETKVATTRYGYTWTLSAIDMLTSHEDTTSNVSSSRKDPAPSRQTER